VALLTREVHDDDEEDHMSTLQDVQTWRGRKMVDADGDKIGTIEDVFLDRQTGQPAWAAVKTGLFGTKHTLVPLMGAEPADDDAIRVPLDKEQVKEAPRIDPDGELSPEDERKLWEHYGLTDYEQWQGDDQTRALALPDEDQDRARQAAFATDASDGDGGDGGDGGGAGAPAIVGVRLRRVVVVAVPAGDREGGQDS
jgi:sporulation protein YlmC with PRC-barrel domain